MSNLEQQLEIINLRNTISQELKLYNMSYTDNDRQIVMENENGEEEIIPVREITYEAKPNARNGASERIIEDFTEEFGWEYISTYKQAWVDGCILHHVYFKY